VSIVSTELLSRCQKTPRNSSGQRWFAGTLNNFPNNFSGSDIFSVCISVTPLMHVQHLKHRKVEDRQKAERREQSTPQMQPVNPTGWGVYVFGTFAVAIGSNVSQWTPSLLLLISSALHP